MNHPVAAQPTRPDLPGSPPVPHRPGHGRFISAAVGAIMLAGVAAVIWLWYPLLRWEYRRHEPWILVLLHFGEAGTVLLCLQWVIAGFRRPKHRLDQPARFERLRYAMPLLILSAGWFIDMGVTRYVLTSDAASYARARRVVGSVERAFHWRMGYTIYCSFTDESGRKHSVRLRFEQAGINRQIGKGWFGDAWPHTFPSPITLRYDPAWPDRCWVDGADPAEAAEFLGMSQVPIFITLFAILFLGAAGRLPYDLERVVPLGIQVAFWLVYAFQDRELRLG